MSTHKTNKKQFSALLDFMKANEGIARGILNAPQYKAKAKYLWDQLQEHLNSLGPPKKTLDGWKKVWKDFKYHTKAKLRHNLKCVRGTGPNKQLPLSNLEEEVVRLLDLTASESGLNVRKFGVSNKSAASSKALSRTENAGPSELEVRTPGVVVASSNDLPNDDGLDYEFSYTEPDLLDSSVIEDNTNPIPPSNNIVDPEIDAEAHVSTPHQDPQVEDDVEIQTPRRVPPKTAKKILQIQVDQQEKYYNESSKILLEQNRLLKENNRELRRQTEEIKELDLLKRKIDLKEKENIENLKIRLEDINLKKRKLELREEKLNFMRH